MQWRCFDPHIDRDQTPSPQARNHQPIEVRSEGRHARRLVEQDPVGIVEQHLRFGPPGVIRHTRSGPDLQASEVLRTLKEDPATRGIPVIVTVDYLSPGRLQELEGDGAAGHLSKLIDRMKLLEEVIVSSGQPAGEPAQEMTLSLSRT